MDPGINLTLWLSLLAYSWSYAQEVFVFDLGDNYTLSGRINISQNPNAYDNQPYFGNDPLVLFSSARNNQTDIRAFSLNEKDTTWLTSTPGSEFSPQPVPGEKAFSCVRLDPDGTQLLYRYSMDGMPSVLIPDMAVGYYAWLSKKKIACFVVGEKSSLVVTNLKNHSHKTLTTSIGRSLQKIPGTNLLSYVSKQNEDWEIRSVNPRTGESAFIVFTLPGVEDMCWTPDGQILMGTGNELYRFDPKKDPAWMHIKTFDQSGISRLTVSPDGEKLAVVFDE